MKWWLNLYFAEGPGIAKDAPKPTGLRLIWATIAREWWNLIFLNVLFLAFCLPLVTIPAALVAMFKVLSLMVEDEPVEVWRDFRETFMQRFWAASGTGIALGLSIAFALISAQQYLLAAADNLLFVMPFVLAAAVGILLSVFAIFTIYLVATQNLSWRDVAKCAAFATLMRPLPVVLALGVNFLIWLLHVVGYPSTVLMAVLFNFSLGALLCAFGADATAKRALLMLIPSEEGSPTTGSLRPQTNQ